jgi:uncharacterized protein YndB with AHSA1/START domain
VTVTSVQKDLVALSLTIHAEFDHPVERVWELWENPRRLERWWGPPTYPATFVSYDLRPGGLASYYMTGPEGDQPRGWWRVIAVDAPHHLVFEDGFADDAGAPNTEMPTMIVNVDLAERPDGGTAMAMATSFPSLESMEQLVAMGLADGLAAAVGQLDDLLQARSGTSIRSRTTTRSTTTTTQGVI